GGFAKYSLILSKAFWQSLSHVTGTFFLSFLNIGSHIAVSFDMNLLMYCNLPMKPRISFSFLGGGMAMIAFTFEGSISIPRELITYPSNLPNVTPNAHFAGFSLMLYF